eukprot:6494046-Prymnesium_polylepis.1
MADRFTGATAGRERPGGGAAVQYRQGEPRCSRRTCCRGRVPLRFCRGLRRLESRVWLVSSIRGFVFTLIDTNRPVDWNRLDLTRLTCPPRAPSARAALSPRVEVNRARVLQMPPPR